MSRGPLTVVVAVFVAVSGAALGGQSWRPERAAHYLDARLAEWFAWKPALQANGPCVSCHTAMTYLLARPVLRRRLGESAETAFETGLLARLRKQVGQSPEPYLQSVETVFAALFLSRDGSRGRLSDQASAAFDRLWTLQHTDGPLNGAWDWLSVDLDPWEHSESSYFGAALAAVAVGQAGPAYASRPDVAPRVRALAAHLGTPASPRRPLHDQLAAVWAASSLPDALAPPTRRAIMDRIFAAQRADGGWDVASLGPWTPHPQAPPAAGSSGYATAYVTFVLQRAGVAAKDARLQRALAWLVEHQDAATGAWPAVSMNKRYPEGSMESRFLQDAATAFASAALVEAGR
jgi:squalene-hopene/tetraprenyl-beta-curcumene cyclase